MSQEQSPAPGAVQEPLYDVVWPLGRTAPEVEALPPRPADLAGKVVAELWDWLYQGDRAFASLRQELSRRYRGIRFVGPDTFGNLMRGSSVIDALPTQLREHGVDVAVLGIGHCGSCTPAVVRAAVAVEAAGVPTVSIVGRDFEALARATALAHGIDGLPLAVYPGRIADDALEEFDAKVRIDVAREVVAGLVAGAPSVVSAGDEPGQRDVVASGTLDDVQDAFEANGWTDGLPIRPPTVERVEAFLSHADRDASELLGKLPPERRELTVWNVAVQGVMAGCRPTHMPLLLAVAEAVADPRFRIETAGAGVGWEPLIVVSGPVIEQLGFNFGAGALRVGSRTNTSIGRFLRLLIRNIAGVRPGATDKTGLGTSFRVVLAEDEGTVAQLGWPTHGEDCGVDRSQSAVTVHSVLAESPQFGEYGCSPSDPAGYLDPLAEVFGRAICGYWLFSSLALGHCHPLVVLSPYVARILHQNGWDKDDVRRYLHERATLSVRSVEMRGSYMNLDIPAQVAAGAVSREYHLSDDPDRLVSAFLRAEWIRIVVAGNPDGYYQQGFMSYPAQGAPVTARLRVVGEGARAADSADAVRERVVKVLRDALEPDGYEFALDWPAAPGGRARVTVTAGPDACANCLVPQDVMRSVLLATMPSDYVSELALEYPGTAPRA